MIASHPTPGKSPGALGLLRVDGTGALLDAEGADELRNTPC